ncbi:FG-GAP-like repeat-containing protein, partial [Kamptonema formosum]|uniref:FG-GAP-like repeat-containing protein n=1 Tax=Kamptonema formosum TaxID=331992 RepID=UPI0005C62942
MANFQEFTGTYNPLNGVDVRFSAAPTFANIDGDTDLDAFVGQRDGTIAFFQNNGGTFTEVTGTGNPFYGVNVGHNSSPSFGDIDGDGDLDAFIRNGNSVIRFFENTSGTFTEVTGTGNFFNSVDVGGKSAPSFVDIDNDGDKDIFIGEDDGHIYFFRNDSGTFTQVPTTDHPLDGVDVGGSSAPVFIDIDGDGDKDAFIGNNYGSVNFYRNDSGIFTQLGGTDNPLGGVYVSYSTSPTLADVDGDGDKDAIVGQFYGGISVYRNDSGTFNQLGGTDNPFDGVDVGYNSAPTFADIDGDGDQDAFIGASDGTVRFYRNDSGTFTAVTGSDNPFNGVNVGGRSTPTFADIDGDGDKDAFIGNSDGNISFFRNDSGTFTQVTGTGNPFDGVNVEGNSAPTFADIDGDSDLDAFIGQGDGHITFLRNDSGTFAKVTTADKPLAGVDVGQGSTPNFADVDGDGDLDAFVTNSQGIVHFYRNDGGLFAEVTGTGNPFDGVIATPGSTPAFANIDGDGDLEAFIGNRKGNVQFFDRAIKVSIAAGTPPSEAGDTPVTGNFVITLSEAAPAGGITVSYTVAGTATAGADYTPLSGTVTFAAGETSATIDVTPILDSVHDPNETVKVTLEEGAGFQLGARTATLNIADQLPFTFTELTGTNNPFAGLNASAKPSFADIDGDGDLDAFIANAKTQSVSFWENDGGTLTEVTGTGNPFGNMLGGFFTPASFGDLNSDGDLDAFVGTKKGAVNFYSNSSGTFTQVTDTSNPFAGVSYSFNLLTLTDIDSDGDLDALGQGSTNFYRNDSGTFTKVTGSDNPLAVLSVTNYSNPVFADIDDDGDLDAIITRNYSSNKVFRNDSGTFTQVAGTDNPLNSVPGYLTDLIFADIDSDGDNDAVRYSGDSVDFYSYDSGTFTQVTGTANPFNGVSVGSAPLPIFADIDGDGDVDAILADGDGTIDTWRNNGGTSFTKLTGSDNPFVDVRTDYYSFLSFEDIDGDGDSDAVIGKFDGTVQVYRNSSGTFTQVTAADDLLNRESLGFFYLAPTLADIDSDGDLDAFVGSQKGVKFFRNDSGTLTEVTGAGNPFDSIPTAIPPSFADIDGDGDLDAFLATGGPVVFFRNDGGTFVAVTDSSNPVAGVYSSTAPTFADFDRDGDLDAFIGKKGTTFVYTNNAGTFTPYGPVGPQGTLFADIDGDGDLDALIPDSKTGNYRLYENSITASVVALPPASEAGATAVPGTFVITLSDPAPDNGITVNYTVGGTATEGDDYTAAFLGSVSFASGETSKTIVVTPVLDALTDANETVTVTLEEGTGFELKAKVATLTILDQTPKTFTEITGSDNPFDGVSVGSSSIPTFADIDGDGDLDAFVGAIDGTVHFYENNSGTFTEVTGSDNPFDGVSVGSYSAPTFADIDGDGDLDAFVGQDKGTVSFYRNDGGTFTEVTGSDNPLNGVSVGSYSTPTFADIDGDGDLDAFVGANDGTVYFCRNDSGTFTSVAGADNPLDGVSVGSASAPAFADIDSDGDLDALIGAGDGTVHFYSNDSGTFTEVTGSDNPFDGVSLGYNSAPTFADIDGDGDLDAVIGAYDGTVYFYENAPTASVTAGTPASEAGTTAVPGTFTVTLSDPAPDAGLTVNYTLGGTATEGADYDTLSGSVTFAAGETTATIVVTPILDNVVDPNETVTLTITDGTDYNLGASASATLGISDQISKTFTEVTGSDNPFDGVNVGFYSAPTFADIDSDGDLDAFIGAQDGTVHFYSNDSGTFTEVTGTLNPFDGVSVGSYSAPTFADIDGDGDLDAFIGEEYGNINFYRNDSGTFTEVTGSDNPFDGVNVGSDNSSLAFADIDSDGDLDAFIGEFDGNINFYRNDSGTFTEVTGSDNPFDGVDVGSYSTPTFADIDSDGDLDAFIGEADGNIYFYRNDSGTFTEVTGSDNPFDGVDVGSYSTPTFADIDKDGDLDAFIGAEDGNIHFYENAITASVTTGTAPAEGGADGTFTITLSQPALDTGLTVSYTVGGTATAGTDYDTLSGTVTFAPGESSKTITVAAVNDVIIDAAETVSITLTDGAAYNLGATATAELTIADNDNPPVIATNAALTADEGATTPIANTVLNVTDTEQTPAELTYTVTSFPGNGTLYLSGVEIAVSDTFTQADIDSGNLTYTHDGSETTSDSFNFTVSDGAGGSISETTFSITVNPTNDAPTLANALANQSATEDSAFTFAIAASTFDDVDAGDTLTYSATLSDSTALPAWLTFDASTGTFNGTPANEDVGTISVKVTATDSAGATADATFDLAVANVNDAPTTTGIGSQTATEDSAFTLDVTSFFTDVDAGDTLTYNATLADSSALPLWLTFDTATGTFEGTPANEDVGDISVKVTATDSAGATVDSTFTLTVANTNDAPTTTGIGNQTATEDSAFSFAIPANTFDDVDAGDSLTLSATLSDGTAIPAWLSFDAATGTFEGTPANEDVGTISVKVTATDSAGATADATFDLAVANVNDAPTTTGIGSQTATEDSAFTLDVTGYFADVDAGDTLTYNATLADGTPMPAWLTFDATAGTFSGTAANEDVGDISVLVT